ncbi:hypothetical protein CCACVL1_09688 [Corchorus capsularis]|uniref:Rhodanese domain-containing protein n=1 Tax=Corchorus capsularis TaxID=210143 RepID=A0A1R3IUN1_COCAP|nr:hypothetical protein CCACVL1_09688 [Corchorus capsularis]
MATTTTTRGNLHHYVLHHDHQQFNPPVITIDTKCRRHSLGKSRRSTISALWHLPLPRPVFTPALISAPSQLRCYISSEPCLGCHLGSNVQITDTEPKKRRRKRKKKMSKEEEYGVLLYYKYAPIPDLDSLLSFYESNCNSLGLLGRVRLSPSGVNVTVGGSLSALEKHIEAVKSTALFHGTDFKLASCHHPSNDKVALECGFTSLSIRVVKELVTFSSYPLLKAPEVSNAGKHLSAAEFHSVLQSAGQLMENGSPTDDNQLVLLDARNLYETRIGKFHAPSVETLDPSIRQYSDLPSWIDENSERLSGKQVLMYCTGGIRCEMASAYIRSKGDGFENVFQLFGGIQRYLEQFPDGGFFRGKNFVFDPRISVGSSDTNILGACLICGASYDDYSSRCRCSHCRMLILVCDSCRIKSDAYVCELCQKHHKGIGSIPDVEGSELEGVMDQSDLRTVPSNTIISSQLPSRHGNGTPRKLRILCLHGFRQTASSFKGRSASLAKKLKSIAELVFVDAPHELPFIYQSHIEPNGSCEPSLGQHAPPPENCKRKFAWLVEPDFSGKSEADWKIAAQPFDPLQYQEQTDGFDVSLAYLKKVFSEQGPFDGILGFSQGAAMAALVCAQGERLKGEIDFRFVILCSGFALPLADFERGRIRYPSLHIFGSEPGKDRQITSHTSRYLASVFDDGCSVAIRCHAYSTQKIQDFGQPTAASHPELMKEGEITPGITAEEYISRRKRLLELLPEKSLAIIAAAPVKMMTDVVPYTFRQDADYSYLTGCQQPGGVAVLSRDCGLCMFMPEAKAQDVVWQGQIAGVDAALEIFKAEKAYPMSKLNEILPDMIKRSSKLFHNTLTASPTYMALENFQRAVQVGQVSDLSIFTHELRWVKSPAELKLMRESASIACQALLQTMLHSKTYPHEGMLSAKFDYECRMRGAQRMAFNPVVGGGPNASVIHYSRNDQKIKDGDLVLMDVGCELHGYCSDLTRTWPPCGSFSSVQEEIYDLILQTNKECMKLCKPGATIREIHNYSVKMLHKGLTEMGILKSDEFRSYHQLNPTSIGHYLGMDVHDSSTISYDCPLKPGVVITIEPGIYLPSSFDGPERFQGTGIRIEDEVLITETGCEVLTGSMPKEIKHIESLLNNYSQGVGVEGHNNIKAAAR